jgi:hypothetical protein
MLNFQNPTRRLLFGRLRISPILDSAVMLQQEKIEQR